MRGAIGKWNRGHGGEELAEAPPTTKGSQRAEEGPCGLEVVWAGGRRMQPQEPEKTWRLGGGGGKGGWEGLKEVESSRGGEERASSRRAHRAPL